jgi:hypothetical protein
VAFLCKGIASTNYIYIYIYIYIYSINDTVMTSPVVAEDCRTPRQTDRDGRYHKGFFAHARVWKHLKMKYGIFSNIITSTPNFIKIHAVILELLLEYRWKSMIMTPLRTMKSCQPRGNKCISVNNMSLGHCGNNVMTLPLMLEDHG